MDKDLDAILANIGGDADSEKSREQALRNGKNTAELTPGILAFREGAAAAIGNHTEFCKNFRMISIEKEGEGELDDIIRQYKYTFIRSIENIEKLYGDYSIVLDARAVDKTARKEYSRYFEGFEERNRLNFVALVETFLVLREFNSLVRKEWLDLDRSIGVINLSSKGTPLFQSLNSVLEGALRFCGETDEFLAFLGRILKILPDHFDFLKSEAPHQAAYHEDFSYDYSELFNPGPYGEAPPKDGAEASGRFASSSGTESVPEAAAIEGAVAAPGENGPSSKRDGETLKDEHCPTSFTVRGTRPWNTREPYIIRLNTEKLTRDGEDLLRSFYFIRTGMEEKNLEGELKRSMLRFMRDGERNIHESYSEFVLKAISTVIQGIVDFFSAADIHPLFSYHLGPYPVYMAVLEGFLTGGTGYCFKYGAGNRVTRFMPQEFIKQQVLEWFEHNVHVFDLPFDSIQEYETIRRMVSKKYFSEVDEKNRKLDELIESKNLMAEMGFDRTEFYRARWKEWFGPANIIVYNRFIEKTIFK